MDKRKGFTLIELLVVISIIALLLSILMPALQKVKEQARKVVCSSNMKTLGLTSVLYASMYDDQWLPYANLSSGPDAYRWWVMNEVFINLLDSETTRQNNNPTGLILAVMPHGYKCPSDRKEPYDDGLGYLVDVSYAYNWTGIFEDPTTTSTTWDGYYGFKTTKIIRPSSKLAFIGGSTPGVYQYEADYTLYWDLYGDIIGPPTNWNVAAYRHSEGANIAFFDGHVEYRKKEEIYRKPDPPSASAEEALNTSMWQPLENGLYKK